MGKHRAGAVRSAKPLNGWRTTLFAREKTTTGQDTTANVAAVRRDYYPACKAAIRSDSKKAWAGMMPIRIGHLS
jgi:hypothetical protein